MVGTPQGRVQVVDVDVEPELRERHRIYVLPRGIGAHHRVADVDGARGVGIEGVLIDRAGRYRREDVPEGVPVIGSLDELLPIVDARLADR